MFPKFALALPLAAPIFVYLAQAGDTSPGTPLWVIAIIVILILLLFWWGVTRPSAAARPSSPPEASSPPQHEHRPAADTPPPATVAAMPASEPVAPQPTAGAWAEAAPPMSMVEAAPADLALVDEEVSPDVAVSLPPVEPVAAMETADALAEATLDMDMPEAAPDNLELIEGIGPRIASILQAAGITTFDELARADVSRLEAIVRDAGLRLAFPESWSEQARLAAAGDWQALEAFQDQLKGGRRQGQGSQSQ
jgi:predicted flap endonuclease-1-like 5' DNA nuclease